MTDPNMSAGEAGGLVAGVVLVLSTLGGGLAWLLNWLERRANSRTAKLDAWQAELAAKQAQIDGQEAAYRALIEQRLSLVEREARAVRRALDVVTTALRQIDPGNAALERAAEILDRAFPLDASLPDEAERELARIDQATKQGRRGRP